MTSPPATSVDAPRYCRRCGYDLRATTGDSPRCPECGRPFDPAKRRTFRRRPLRPWLRQLKRIAFALAALLFLLAATWGWFYWGWLDEQRALRALSTPDGTRSHDSVSLYPWLRDRLGPAGFVFDRVNQLHWPDPPQGDLRPLARLTHLTELEVSTADICDLSPLSKLTELRSLFLRDLSRVSDLRPLAAMKRVEVLILHGDVRDVSPLSSMTALRTLCIAGTSVRDLSPLTTLKNLRWLSAGNTPVSDLTPLRGLRLEALDLGGTQVSDLSPLAGQRHLERLELQNTPVRDLTPLRSITSLVSVIVPLDCPDSQDEALRAALPGCAVVQWP